MLKRENVKEVKVENGKVFIHMVDGTKKEVKAVRNKEWLKNRLKKENFALSYLIEDYNEYNRICNRVFKFVKSRYLVDLGIEFRYLTGRNGIIRYDDCMKTKKTREDGTVVNGYTYFLSKETKISDLEKLHNAFDNIVAMEYKNKTYGLFVGTKKMRNYK